MLWEEEKNNNSHNSRTRATEAPPLVKQEVGGKRLECEGPARSPHLKILPRPTHSPPHPDPRLKRGAARKNSFLGRGMYVCIHCLVRYIPWYATIIQRRILP